MTRYAPLRFASLLVLLGFGPLLLAGTPLRNLRFSSDVSVNLGGADLNDESVGEDDLQGFVSPVSVGGIPAEMAVDAYHLLPTDEQLISLDIHGILGGTLAVGPADVIRFDGSSFHVEFDARANGVPPTAGLDALSLAGGMDFVFSFDETISLDGNTFDDEDLIRFDGAQFSMFLDGSAAGVPEDLDIDALHYLEGSGRLFLSFDGSGAIGGTGFDDEDVLEHDPGAGTWEMAYDGSSHHSGWEGADLDAVHVTPSCQDLDGDGFGSEGDPACPGGLAADCDDQNGQVWQTPGEVRNLRFLDTGTMTWDPPTVPGATLVGYDVLRSDDPANFEDEPCIEENDTSDTSATDTKSPLPGWCFYYLVRARNACPPDGLGSLGQDSNGTERVGECP